MPDDNSAIGQNRRFLLTLAGIQAFCGTVFGLDMIYETALETFNSTGISAVEAVHLVAETIAVGLLFFGYWLAHRELNLLRDADAQKAKKLNSLRGHFDDIITAQFLQWNLSPAERDIALLSLRGSRISDIARMRNTSEGTVKAQLSAVYHKSGINTRTELLAFFMDEFLDYSTEDGAKASVAQNAGLPLASAPAR